MTGQPLLSVLIKIEDDFSTSCPANSRTIILKTSFKYLKVKVQPDKEINLFIRFNSILKYCRYSL